MHTRRVAAAVAVVAFAALAVLWNPAARHYHAAHLLATLSAPAADGPGGDPGAILVETDVVVERAERKIRSRIYRLQDGGRRRGVVIAHGVHYKGIDERRLVPFARALAREGLVVLTPELREMADYRITEDVARDIGASVDYLSSRADLLDDPRVGLIGFSFAGGMSLVASADPAVGERLSWVVSIGGHHDLGRVLRFFVDDEIPTPRGLEKRAAHEYGLVVLLYGHIEEFVPPLDQEAARDALRAWLQEDRDKAREEAKRCSSDPCKQVFELVQSGKARELGPRVRTLIAGSEAALARMSPKDRMQSIIVPVYLLHGGGDSVIPATESEWAAQELGDRPHLLEVSPLIEHVEVNKPASWQDKLDLVRFMAAIM